MWPQWHRSQHTLILYGTWLLWMGHWKHSCSYCCFQSSQSQAGVFVVVEFLQVGGKGGGRWEWRRESFLHLSWPQLLVVLFSLCQRVLTTGKETAAWKFQFLNSFTHDQPWEHRGYIYISLIFMSHETRCFWWIKGELLREHVKLNSVWPW